MVLGRFCAISARLLDLFVLRWFSMRAARGEVIGESGVRSFLPVIYLDNLISSIISVNGCKVIIINMNI